MYKSLLEQGFGISEVDQWDIHWFWECMEMDTSKPATKQVKHGTIEDVVW